jgi:hypothetical protein
MKNTKYTPNIPFSKIVFPGPRFSNVQLMPIGKYSKNDLEFHNLPKNRCACRWLLPEAFDCYA